MIKPEDVPESLVYDMYAQMKKCLELDELGMPVSTEQQIADLLNLCVEAGIVSPSCWAVRDSIGDIVTHRRVFTAKSFASEQFGHRPGYVIEHWKGQV